MPEQVPVADEQQDAQKVVQQTEDTSPQDESPVSLMEEDPTITLTDKEQEAVNGYPSEEETLETESGEENAEQVSTSEDTEDYDIISEDNNIAANKEAQNGKTKEPRRTEDLQGTTEGVQGPEVRPGDNQVHSERPIRQEELGASKRGNARPILDSKAKKILTKVKALVDLRDVSDNKETFCKDLDQNKSENKHGGYVDSKTVEDLDGALCISTPNGKATVAILKDGDIVAVSKGKSDIKNASTALILTARMNGGTKMDCFGIHLVRTYEKVGFIPVARVPFNEGRVDDPLLKKMRPDVYVMMKNSDSIIQVARTLDGKGYAVSTQAELDALPTFEDYNEALAYRDKLLKEQEGSEKETKKDEKKVEKSKEGAKKQQKKTEENAEQVSTSEDTEDYDIISEDNNIAANKEAQNGKTKEPRGTEDLQGTTEGVQGRPTSNLDVQARLQRPVGQETLARNQGVRGGVWLKDLGKLVKSVFKNDIKIYDVSKDLQQFVDSLSRAIEYNVHGGFVSKKEIGELQGDTCLLTDDSGAGIAITKDGDIVALHKGESKYKKLGKALVFAARKMGGTKMDCFGIHLVHTYEDIGFIPVARLPFNEGVVDDPLLKKMRPDVYVMMKNTDTIKEVAKKIKGKKYKLSTQAELDALPTFEDYNEALAYRDKLLKEQEESGKETKKDEKKVEKSKEGAKKQQKKAEESKENVHQTVDKPKKSKPQKEKAIPKSDNVSKPVENANKKTSEKTRRTAKEQEVKILSKDKILATAQKRTMEAFENNALNKDDVNDAVLEVRKYIHSLTEGKLTKEVSRAKKAYNMAYRNLEALYNGKEKTGEFTNKEIDTLWSLIYNGQCYKVADTLLAKIKKESAETKATKKKDTKLQMAGEKAVGSPLSKEKQKAYTKLYEQKQAQGWDWKKINEWFWNQKGVVRGKDNLWRFEISDKDFAFSDHFLNNIDKIANVRTLDIERCIKHEKLFKAYPQLKQWQIGVVDKSKMNNASVYTNDEHKVIVIAKEDIGTTEAEETVIHELQHAIQSIEGFSVGSGTDIYEMAKNHPNKVKELLKTLWIEEGSKEIKGITEKQIKRKLDNIISLLTRKKRIDMQAFPKQIAADLDRVADYIYKNHYGEMEAEDTEKRFKALKNSESTQNTPPMATQYDKIGKSTIIQFNKDKKEGDNYEKRNKENKRDRDRPSIDRRRNSESTKTRGTLSKHYGEREQIGKTSETRYQGRKDYYEKIKEESPKVKEVEVGKKNAERDVYAYTFTKSAQQFEQNRKIVERLKQAKQYWAETKMPDGGVHFERLRPQTHQKREVVYSGLNGKDSKQIKTKTLKDIKLKTLLSQDTKEIVLNSIFHKNALIKYLFNDKVDIENLAKKNGQWRAYMEMMVAKDQGHVAEEAIRNGIIKADGTRTASLNSIIEKIGIDNQNDFNITFL